MLSELLVQHIASLTACEATIALTGRARCDGRMLAATMILLYAEVLLVSSALVQVLRHGYRIIYLFNLPLLLLV